jgi:uncharacterized membrane protein (UPF0127 family)
MRHVLSFIVLLSLCACFPERKPASEEITFEKTSVEIARPGRPPLKLNVELADTPEKLERGLMYRSEMDDNAGMLFKFPAESFISMWMANTSISLDMFFADSRGRITEIVEETVPLSRERITSSEKTKIVLEMKAGTAGRLDIRPGDTIRLPIFGLEKEP